MSPATSRHNRKQIILVTLSTFLLALGVGWIDHASGPEISFSIFYLIPIAFAAWFAHRSIALVLALFCAIIWFTADKMSGQAYSHPAIAHWNAIMRLGYFVLGAYVVSYIHDRTRRALWESEQRFQLLIESITDYAIIMLNPKGNIVSWNTGAKRILGYEKGEILEKHVSRFIPENEDTVGKARREMEEALKTGRFEDESWRVRKGGGLFWANVIVSPIHDEKDGLIGFAKIIRDLTERKKVQMELEKSREELRRLTNHLETAREEERTRIAREIHDELGQDLTGLKMDLSWLTKKIPEIPGKGPDAVLQKIGVMDGLIDQTIDHIRKIVTELRPGILDHLGLPAAIEWQAQEFEARTQIHCLVDLRAKIVSLAADRVTGIFRIFQEILVNVTRHAKATEVSVRLDRADEHLILEVTDNGRGIHREAINDSRSLGLIGMRERALLLGGRLDIGGSESRGTTVRLEVPFKEEHAA
ncbi:MAG: PAS domain S-box protein [Deltaproteobacteria bacterium]|nr:PAS domain S-box protein [Deltaproteobacteria bacterium]